MPELGVLDFLKLPTQTPTGWASTPEKPAEVCPKGRSETQSMTGVRKTGKTPDLAQN